jgi:3-carboxy-cis,cis-muconate cycloisomerase
MASSIIDSNYYRDMFGTSEMREIFSDDARLQGWIDTEIALAIAQEKLNIIPVGISRQIKDKAKIENLDTQQMKLDFDRVGFPILPFVKQVNKCCGIEASKWIHYGATTQDILDTGMVLQMKKGLVFIEEQLSQINKALVKLTEDHQQTVMAGRTFQQLAAPITFGYKTAVWLNEVQRHQERIKELKKRLLVGQCAGAVGSFATLGNQGLKVQELMMKDLDLSMPHITWHTARDCWGELVSTFALIGATFAKIANEVAILMRSEIGELSEPFEIGRGASTTLPQKRNPISCEPIIAIAPKLRELVGMQLTAMIQEHERGVGKMNMEWILIPEAFIYLSGSLKHSCFILENLWVDKENMIKNLSLSGGLIMSEAVMMGMAIKVGKADAHHLVYNAASHAHENKITLKESLLKDNIVMKHLTIKELDFLLDPINYIGVCEKMSSRVLNNN